MPSVDGKSVDVVKERRRNSFLTVYLGICRTTFALYHDHKHGACQQDSFLCVSGVKQQSRHVGEYRMHKNSSCILKEVTVHQSSVSLGRAMSSKYDKMKQYHKELDDLTGKHQLELSRRQVGSILRSGVLCGDIILENSASYMI